MYLTNPYYLSLWVDLIAEESNIGDDYVPTIDELHERELKREFLKSMKITEHEFYQQHPSLIINTKKVLSVLSYYIRFFVTWYGSIGGHKSTKSLSGKRFN